MPVTRRDLLLAAGAALAAPAAAFAAGGKKDAAPAVLKGRALKPGDTIGIAAPASPVSEGVLYRGVGTLEAHGFNVKLGAHVFEEYGFFAGTAEQRAADINALFADPEFDAILGAKGGYGTAGILDLIDYGAIAAHPKQLIGYSDITGLETAIWQKTGLITVNGAMLRSLSGEGGYTEENFFRGLTTLRPMGAIVPPEGELTAIRPGKAAGRIVGGNLTLIASLAGTPYELKGDGCILVLEEVHEKSYRIDRMLRQLYQNGLFSRIAGLAWGEFYECGTDEGDFTVDEVLRHWSKVCGKPALCGLPVGHRLEATAYLPIGAMAEIEADETGGALFTVTEAHAVL
jgi:muramoyltetrapeptide carboxypeptidase